MTPAEILQLMTLLGNAPTIAADSVQLYATIAHGEGGLGKVEAGLAALGKLISDALSGATPQATVTPATPAAA